MVEDLNFRRPKINPASDQNGTRIRHRPIVSGKQSFNRNLCFELRYGTVWGDEFCPRFSRNLVIANCHFEVARETGSRWLSMCFVGLLWRTHFQNGGKFVPQNSPTKHVDNNLYPVSRATSKWRKECLSFMYTANGNRQFQIENFSI